MLNTAHLAHWPPGLPHHLTLPQTSLVYNLEVSAARFPDKPFIVFYDTQISFARFKREVEHLAGHLQQVCGVQAGDRVLIDMQNSPQWALAFYAILRANAVAVPVNPMNRTDELRHAAQDSGARAAFVAQELLPHLLPVLDDADTPLQHLVVATYSDYLLQPTDLPVPDFVRAPAQPLTHPNTHAWADVLATQHAPGPHTTGPDDLCVMPYTSGTTGRPKGCKHTHRSVMSTLVGGVHWFGRTQDAVYLSVLPFFHVTGLSGSLNGPLYIGATIVILPRWDRDTAATCMQRYRVTVWQCITTMAVDFLANPRLGDYDLSSLSGIRGGGAAMPEAVALRLKQLTGLDYVEGYGMSETMAATHINPPHRVAHQAARRRTQVVRQAKVMCKVVARSNGHHPKPGALPGLDLHQPVHHFMNRPVAANGDHRVKALRAGLMGQLNGMAVVFRLRPGQFVGYAVLLCRCPRLLFDETAQGCSRLSRVAVVSGRIQDQLQTWHSSFPLDLYEPVRHVPGTCHALCARPADVPAYIRTATARQSYVPEQD